MAWIIESGAHTLELQDDGNVTMYHEGDPCGSIAPVGLVVQLLRDAGWTCEPPPDDKEKT